MKLIKKTEQINKIGGCNIDLVYVNNVNEILYKNEVVFISNSDLRQIYSYSENIFFTNTIFGDGVIVDLNNDKVEILKGEFVNYFDGIYLISDIERNTIIYRNRIEIGKLLYRVSLYFIDVERKLYIHLLRSESSIVVYELENQIVRFSYKLQSLGTFMDGAIETPYQVMEFSGIYQNILVCTLNSGGILLLDLQTGQMLEHFREVGIRSGVYQESEGSSRFLGLKHTTFIEIDVVERKIIRRINLESQFKELMHIPNETPCWFTAGTSIYKNGLFYFYGDRNVLVIFDPKSEKIIDHYAFKFEKTATQLKGGNENLQVVNDEVYCLDTSGTLHVLEKN